ncbi:hypothetical protein [Acinetobacter guerrae]|uniref:hypothetical protein n=1 Tax=Acinetobacter guerrae TaxID=1843371 RepID=UPI00125EA688|nr:hypothetical protein [Acinetobacter guerrae]MPW44266.1 hypothetical protein [Acinetobacter guerrae]
MELIEIEPHFWELYQQGEQLFLSIAIDLSSVVSCWDILLSDNQIKDYQLQGRESIHALANQFVIEVYRGESQKLEQHQASAQQKIDMQKTFSQWKIQNKSF